MRASSATVTLSGDGDLCQPGKVSGWFDHPELRSILERVGEIAGAAVLIDPDGAVAASACNLGLNIDLAGLAETAISASLPVVTVDLEVTTLDLVPVKLRDEWYAVVMLDRRKTEDPGVDASLDRFDAYRGADLLTELAMCCAERAPHGVPPSNRGSGSSPAEDFAGFAWPVEKG